jgi:hypothetical protein
MDAKRTPLPPQSRPVRMGQPYHGLLTDGVLTLSTGAKISFPGSPLGDCYKFVVPGASLSIAPTEVALEAAQGREWRSYALLSGRARSYAGIEVGADAWLYADANGDVWRIRCAQLNNALIQPSAPVNTEGTLYGYYPAALDFQFEITRWGLISPDQTVAAVRTIVIQGVALGPSAHKSDPITYYPIYTPDTYRMFPGDGYGYQYMPINIDDVSTSGAKCLFCVNRSAEVSTRALSGGNGRAYPLAWIEVQVSGSGDAITISMTRVRDQQTYDGSYTLSSNVTTGTWSATVGPDHFSGPQRPSCSYVLSLSAGRCAGGYYDSADVLRWVLAGQSRTDENYSGSASFTVQAVGADFNQTAYIGDYSATSTMDLMITTSCTMGPHSYSPTPVIGSGTGQMRVSGETLTSAEPSSPVAFSSSDLYRSTITTVLGQRAHEGSGSAGSFLCAPRIIRPGLAGVDVVNFPSNPVSEYPSIAKGLELRSLDGLSLVRVSNKVYAVTAYNDGSNGAAAGSALIAIGTPDGWTTVNDHSTSFYQASYNPGTGQLAYSAQFGYGWV